MSPKCQVVSHGRSPLGCVFCGVISGQRLFSKEPFFLQKNLKAGGGLSIYDLLNQLQLQGEKANIFPFHVELAQGSRTVTRDLRGPRARGAWRVARGTWQEDSLLVVEKGIVTLDFFKFPVFL